MGYDYQKIEKKWQKYWEDNQTFKTDVWDFSKPKFYALDMFPYPSGVGLHAGHPEGYTATDIVSRMKRMQGYNVLHPMGYDSFGLPAEQYAIQTGNHPENFTKKNIETFSKQLKELGFDTTLFSEDINKIGPIDKTKADKIKDVLDVHFIDINNVYLCIIINLKDHCDLNINYCSINQCYYEKITDIFICCFTDNRCRLGRDSDV